MVKILRLFPFPRHTSKLPARWLVAAALLLTLSGCTSLPGEGDERDPFESFNREVHAFNWDLNREVLRPVSQGYADTIPTPIQTGVSNFFGNLNDVLVVFNDLLQAKFAQATSDFSRLVWNSTVGLFGVLDVATPMGMPKHQEDFGQTLAAWGVPDGPYLVLPILGPSTVRDAAGVTVDIYTHPLFNGLITDNNANLAAAGLRIIDINKNLLGTYTLVEQSGVDPYLFMRDAYLQYRRSLIYDGFPPIEDVMGGLDPGADSVEEDLELELELESELDAPPSAPATTPH